MPKPFKVKVRRNVVEVIARLIPQFQVMDLPGETLQELEGVQKHFLRILHDTENEVRCLAKADELDKKRFANHESGADWYFALRQTDPSDEDGKYELYLCLKSEWFRAQEKFPWRNDWPANPELRKALEGSTDTDNGLYWYSGDLDSMILRARSLVDCGAEELPAILGGLRVMPPDRDSEGDFACSTDHVTPSTVSLSIPSRTDIFG